jgi:hypothetical protein
VVAFYFYTWAVQIINVQAAQITLQTVAEVVVGTCVMGGTLEWAFRKGDKSYKAWGWVALFALSALAIYWSHKITLIRK